MNNDEKTLLYDDDDFFKPKPPTFGMVLCSSDHKESTFIIRRWAKFVAHCIHTKKVKVEKGSNNQRIVFVCEESLNCNWQIQVVVKKIRNYDADDKVPVWIITKLNEYHNNCSATGSSLSAANIALAISAKNDSTMNKKLTKTEIESAIQGTNLVSSTNFNKTKIYDIKIKALQCSKADSFSQGFEYLTSYLLHLKHLNPDSVIDLQHTMDQANQKRFGRCIIMMSSTVNIVTVGACKPVISFDASFLKTNEWEKYQLMAAGNDY